MCVRLIQISILQREFLTSILHSSTKLSRNLRYKSSQPTYIYNMNEAYLRFVKGQENFQFTFRYVNPEYNFDRQFNFNRKASETVSTFLKRINANVNKCMDKKKNQIKKKKSKKLSSQLDIQEEEISDIEKTKNETMRVALFLNESTISDDLTCESIFENSSQLILYISDLKYIIKHNVPWIDNISLSKSILVGFPTYPSIFDSVYTNLKDSEFIWYKSILSNSPNKVPKWIEVGKGYLYLPSIDDFGCLLKLSCIPANKTQRGPLTEIESPNPVEAGPGRCPFEDRHKFTKEKLNGDCFRIMSYNILADCYADSNFSREVLFSYCPAYALQIDYRKQLILKEIIGFNADIICLQEVDRKVYETDLFPALTLLNYDGVYNRKGADIVEGLSTFFNTERYEKLHFKSIIISENLELEKFNLIWEKVQNSKMKERFQERNTAIQATVLRSKEDPREIFVIGNTHLYFHPNACHIRLLQGFYVITYLENLTKNIEKENPDCNVSIIVCGDFNSGPKCGIYQLMTTKHIPCDHQDWNGVPEEAVTDISLSHGITFSSACGTPEFTNYTKDFAGCLDYIYYETSKFQVKQIIPMPSTEELSLNIAIPSVVFPSDHISLCADLRRKRE